MIDDVTPSTSTVFSSTRSNNTYEPKNSNIQGHISNNTTNPHNVTKSQIGLSNVDNTSDVNKPISNATSTALNSKQDTLVSGTNIKTINGSSVLGSGNIVVIDGTSNQSVDGVKTFTSSPIVPTPTIGDNSTKAATTAFVKNEIPNALNATGTSPIYACRAWVNFNGTGTVAIRASGNVSSITDNGVGDYTVNFTTAMSDTNYSPVFGLSYVGSGSYNFINSHNSVAPTTISLRILTGSTSVQTDSSYASVAIFR